MSATGFNQTTVAAEAEALFPYGGDSIRTLAGQLATSTPRAADYIHQAPVLVLAVVLRPPAITKGSPLSRAKVRDFARHVQHGPKLRALMKHYGVAPPFRVLCRGGLAETNWSSIAALSRSSLTTSALAQAIPAEPRAQESWFSHLAAWHQRCGGSGLDWIATVALSARDIGLTCDVADFYRRSGGTTFNPRWTFEQAEAAMGRWHDRLTMENIYPVLLGVSLKDRLNPEANLPRRLTIGPYDFVALETCEALFLEGRAMHHCVASYAPDVRNGRCAIYSVRAAGDRRVATLELGVSNDHYTLVQLRGPHNANVDHQVFGAARDFAVRLNEPLFAFAKQPQELVH